MKNVDRLNFSKVYYYVGVLKGRARLLNNHDLLKLTNELETQLNIALGYEEKNEEIGLETNL